MSTDTAYRPGTMFPVTPPGTPAPGNGHYASYHALWHLSEIGVVPDLTTYESAAWDDAERWLNREGARPTRVALIDVSVACSHPNLEPAILRDLTIDFFSARLGTFPRPDDAGFLADCLKRKEAKASWLPKGARAHFEELCEHLPKEFEDRKKCDWTTPLRVAPSTSEAFSAHGTAMAGLIGARPLGAAVVARMATHHIGGGNGQPIPTPTEPVSLPYVGVDPFCDLIPISTSFAPDPEQLILALLYAWLVEADVIVLARDFSDPKRTMVVGPAGPGPAVDSYPVPISDNEVALWDALHELVLALSSKIPIVCAAGNGTDEPLMYPASLAREDNGIIAVGARAATGQRTGYSSIEAPGRGSEGGVTIYAPSGDGERLDRVVQRLDTADADFLPGDHSALYLHQLGVQHPALPPKIAPQGPATSIFSTQEIITTDVPGAAGYNSSLFGHPTSSTGAILDYRSYYCHFSGTSAACAIVAGAVSLAISAGKVDRGKPVEIKRQLRGMAVANDDAGTPWLDWNTLTRS